MAVFESIKLNRITNQIILNEIISRLGSREVSVKVDASTGSILRVDVPSITQIQMNSLMAALELKFPGSTL